MATHCSVLAWRIPGTGEPGGLLSMGSHRVGHDWSDLAAAAYISGIPWWLSSREPACRCRRCRFDPWIRKVPWRRKWQPAPVFLPGKSHAWRSLECYSPWGSKESDTASWLSMHIHRDIYIYVYTNDVTLCTLNFLSSCQILEGMSLTCSPLFLYGAVFPAFK